jgi:hypothetical protein
MPYVVHLKRSAEKKLADLPREVQQRIIKRLLTLNANAPVQNKLTGIMQPPWPTLTQNSLRDLSSEGLCLISS